MFRRGFIFLACFTFSLVQQSTYASQSGLATPGKFLGKCSDLKDWNQSFLSTTYFFPATAGKYDGAIKVVTAEHEGLGCKGQLKKQHADLILLTILKEPQRFDIYEFFLDSPLAAGEFIPKKRGVNLLQRVTASRYRAIAIQSSTSRRSRDYMYLVAGTAEVRGEEYFFYGVRRTEGKNPGEAPWREDDSVFEEASEDARFDSLHMGEFSDLGRRSLKITEKDADIFSELNRLVEK